MTHAEALVLNIHTKRQLKFEAEPRCHLVASMDVETGVDVGFEAKPRLAAQEMAIDQQYAGLLEVDLGLGLALGNSRRGGLFGHFGDVGKNAGALKRLNEKRNT